MGSAVAVECIAAEAWIEQMVSAKMLELPKLVGSDEYSTMVLFTVVLAAELLKDTSPCFSKETKLGDSPCSRDFVAASKELREATFERISARLMAIPGMEAYLRKMTNEAQ